MLELQIRQEALLLHLLGFDCKLLIACVDILGCLLHVLKRYVEYAHNLCQIVFDGNRIEVGVRVCIAVRTACFIASEIGYHWEIILILRQIAVEDYSDDKLVNGPMILVILN